MLETSLRDKGVTGRVVSLHLRALPEGVHVMKYLPLTPLYAEETMFQVRPTPQPSCRHLASTLLLQRPRTVQI